MFEFIEMNNFSDKICDKIPEISAVVVGDSQCGKTQLINRFSRKKFSQVRHFLYSSIPASNKAGINWITGSDT